MYRLATFDTLSLFSRISRRTVDNLMPKTCTSCCREYTPFGLMTCGSRIGATDSAESELSGVTAFLRRGIEQSLDGRSGYFIRLYAAVNEMTRPAAVRGGRSCRTLGCYTDCYTAFTFDQGFTHPAPRLHVKTPGKSPALHLP